MSSEVQPQPLLVHEQPMATRWRDMDIQHHVNNANFFTFVEEARAVWLGDIPNAWDLGSFVPVLAHADMNFLRPMAWPTNFVVELRATEVAESSLVLQHKIVDAVHRDRIYAVGSVKLVWVHPREKRKVPLPETVRTAATHPTSPQSEVLAG